MLRLRTGLLVGIAVFGLLISSSGSNSVSKPYCAEQQAGNFSIDVGTEDINVYWVDSQGVEAFRVVVLKNGGINEIRIAHASYATNAGWYIWYTDYEQTKGSNATAEPIIQNLGDRVVLTCFGKCRVQPLSIVTNITICKTGVILISTNLIADADAPITTSAIGWGLWGFPADLWKGGKAYANLEGKTIQEVSFPIELVRGAQAYILFSLTNTRWMDFSKSLEGTTVVNMAPHLWSRGEIIDEREWNGTVFSCRYRLVTVAAVKKGERIPAKVAIYIHGPGGYQGNLEMINLLVDLGSAEGGAEKGLQVYKDAGARNLASQALANVRSAYDKIVTGDVTSVQSDLSQASNLLKQAESAEQTAALIRDLTLTAIPIAVIVVVLVLRMRRKK